MRAVHPNRHDCRSARYGDPLSVRGGLGKYQFDGGGVVDTNRTGRVLNSTPLFLMAEGVRRVGAAKAALISTIGPPATAF